jgi:hypothetical protein
VEILMACLCLAMGQVKAGMRYAQAGVQHSKVGAFNGLVVLTRAEAGKIYHDAEDAALSFLARLEAETQWQSRCQWRWRIWVREGLTKLWRSSKKPARSAIHSWSGCISGRYSIRCADTGGSRH